MLTVTQLGSRWEQTQADRVVVCVTASFGRQHRGITKACCWYSLKKIVNSMIINVTSFGLDLSCFVVKHIWDQVHAAVTTVYLRSICDYLYLCWTEELAV